MEIKKESRVILAVLFVIFVMLLTWLLLPTFSFASAQSVQVHQAWAKPTLKGNMMGVAYVTLENTGEETISLVAASSPVAERVEIHTHSQGDNGMMQMRQLPALEMAPNSKHIFKPGGLHFMLFGMKQPLAMGDSFPLTLEFDGQPAQELEIQVRKQDG